jgi:hypothetical protein
VSGGHGDEFAARLTDLDLSLARLRRITDTNERTNDRIDEALARIRDAVEHDRPTLTLIQGGAATPSGGWRDRQQAS